MKAKTIRRILRQKVDAWLASIEDSTVRDLAAKNTIVTGGAIASMLLDEQVNDYDLYFKTYELALAVARYYVSKFKVETRKGITCRIFVADGDGFEISNDRKVDRIKIVIKSAGIASEEGTQVPYEYFESRAEGEGGNYVASVMQDPGTIEDTYEETEALALQEDVDGKPQYRPVFMSTNAITLSQRIQLVI